MYDDRLEFMAMTDVLRLDGGLRREDVSDVWMVWSGAAEVASQMLNALRRPYSKQRPYVGTRRCAV